MPNKRTRNDCSSKAQNQPYKSKYFISNSSYPTSFLRKRHGANEDTKVTENLLCPV